MARINQHLLTRLESKLRIGRKQVYALIQRKGLQTHLPSDLAAIALAAEKGVGITRYASVDELAQIRHATSGLPAASPTPMITNPAKSSRKIAARENRVLQRVHKRGKSVFVVHGRDEDLRRSLFAFLRSIGLNPIEWRKAIQLTGRPSPYVGEILEAAFSKAVAVVVLLSPDDEAKLRSEFLKQSDDQHERSLTGQPRPNVLFESGMAFGRKPDKTVLVQVGQMRPFSDIAGRHVVHLSDSPESRQELATKLESAGCIVDLSGSDWLREGKFETTTENEADRIRRVLAATSGNKNRAAKLLGMERKTLYRKLDSIGL
jgi:predicted nucleotide-binding protein